MIPETHDNIHEPKHDATAQDPNLDHWNNRPLSHAAPAAMVLRVSEILASQGVKLETFVCGPDEILTRDDAERIIEQAAAAVPPTVEESLEMLERGLTETLGKYFALVHRAIREAHGG